MQYNENVAPRYWCMFPPPQVHFSIFWPNFLLAVILSCAFVFIYSAGLSLQKILFLSSFFVLRIAGFDFQEFLHSVVWKLKLRHNKSLNVKDKDIVVASF